MITPTGSQTGYLQDPRLILDRAIATGAAVIAGVQPSQLTDPTPCTEMDVRALLAHLVGVLDRITALGRGDDPFAVTETAVADDRWTDAWRESGRRAAAAWSDDAVLVRPMALPWIAGNGAEVLASYFSELTVHTWDLATATGRQPDWDDTVVAAAFDGARQILPAENRRDLYEEISAARGFDEVAVPFAEAVPIPDDAPAIDRLVAWNGRDPRRRF
ncbi:TIGR03086 family metal-binding protein [Mycolicibacterium sp. HK-90]|uniref:TIGR03086 family metal-binding protein n=1 Tax=Mycolicibacterium sp. HK-90 TaxID=3056937 RepID=UPI00265B27C6|nr:TIGR03086 family metal-binding protein [Mycolicibacterium sp. HK-90]WKG00816.1 TIGR03086 family metal-binding protein [Mycolicibacterium sp. HK-90]